MCPKAKSDQVITHRIEFQETERDALEMVAASITARNVTQSVTNLTKGVGNLIDPVLSASFAGVAAALGIIAWYELRNEETSKTTFDYALGEEPGWIGRLLLPLSGPDINSPGYKRLYQDATPEEKKAVRQQQNTNFRMKLNQFRNAISTELMKVTRKESI
jgi:hypothetical protein